MSTVIELTGETMEHGYEGLRDSIAGQAGQVGPLFTTDAADLFSAFLDALPLHRQHYNCHACRRFVDGYGGLVTIDAVGRTHPAIWPDHGVPSFFLPAVSAVRKIVSRASVTGVFLSSASILGTPQTGDWSHFHALIPLSSRFEDRLRTPGQAMAEKREDFANVRRALAEFDKKTVATALSILSGDYLYRSEKVIGPVEWLHKLHESLEAAIRCGRDNVVWRAIAAAPAGFCHPRSSMAGTLLEDIAAGMDFEDVSRRFAAKMRPGRYQRPQADPSTGNIARAEEIVAKLGIARSLERRFARLDEVEPIWLPAAPIESKRDGVFGHLSPKGVTDTSTLSVPPVTMTWEKFSRTVLPTAESIEYFAGVGRDTYTALVTAVHADAPPILQWDREDRRNPVSWYFWMSGSAPADFCLKSNAYHKVNAIALNPSQWGPDPDAFPNQGRGVLFVLDGARETRMSGNALFPEILKADLREVRSTIEAYSRSAKIEGMADGSACGVMVQAGQSWKVRIRVTSRGLRQDYHLDRWD